MQYTHNFSLKGLICLFICFISTTVVYSQNNDFQHKKDSLLKVIASTKGEEKLEAYKALTFPTQYSKEEVDLMLQHINDFIREARKQQNKKYECIAYQYELVYLWNNLIHDKFEQKANEYLPFFKKNGFSKYYYNTYLFLLNLSRKNDPKQVIEGAKQMYEEAKQENCLFGITQATCLIAQTYFDENRYGEAEKYYGETIKDALKLILKEPDIANYTLVLNGYDGLTHALGMQDKLNEMLSLMPAWKKHAIDYEKMFGRPDPFLSSYYNLFATAYIDKDEYDKAELYCDSLEQMNLKPSELNSLLYVKAEI